MNSKRKTLLPLRIAVILLCAVLISSHFASGLIAKYTIDSNGADSARVAIVNINVGQLQGSNGSYTFDVVNNSEIAFAFDVIVTFRNPSAGINVTQTFDDSSVKLNGNVFSSKSTDGRSFTFSRVGVIDACSSLTGFDLSFDITGLAIHQNSNATQFSVMNDDFPFAVAVKVYQLD